MSFGAALVFSWALAAAQPSPPTEATPISAQIVRLVNRDRLAHRLTPLTVEDRLTRAAQRKAEDMQRRGYFDHVDPDGRRARHLLERVGYEFRNVAELLARGPGDFARMQRGWMNSPPHRRSMLSTSFTQIGVGAIRTEPDTWIVVVLFARPAS